MTKKIFILSTLLIFSLVGFISAQEKVLYDFTVKDIDENNFDLSQLEGKKVLIVNVASKCGYTPQYAQLEELYQKYKDKGLVILGFPSNDFKGQEPGTNEEIKEFCTLNYGVTFPIMDKVDVIGDKKVPLYKWLTEKKENGKLDAEVQWNFQKFMINPDGTIFGYVLPKENPLSDTIIDWIEMPNE